LNEQRSGAVLEQHPFARELGAQQVRKLAGCAIERTFETGEYLWRQGEASDWLFLLRSGEVSLEISVPNEGPLTVETFHEGEAIGWAWFEPPYRCQFDARAATPVKTLALPGACVREQCERDNALAHRVFRQLAGAMAHGLERVRLKLVKPHPVRLRNGER
jgi:CRP/FNR family transcriptional regulator, cyclic AMP receptor protein